MLMPEKSIDGEIARLSAEELKEQKRRHCEKPLAKNGGSKASVKQVTVFLQDEYGVRLAEAIMLIEHRRDLMNLGIREGLRTDDVARAIWRGKDHV
jgi:hypothetical protein